MAHEPPDDGLRNPVRYLVRYCGAGMEGIRVRSGHTVPRVCRSDSDEHVPQEGQPATYFCCSTDAAHDILDTVTVLQLARIESRVRSQRVPADVLHHRLHHRPRLGSVCVPRQAVAAGLRQRHRAHRRHTGHTVRAAGAGDLQRLGHPVHRGLLLLEEQDFRDHR